MRGERKNSKQSHERDSQTPVYHISIVAQMVEVHPQTLRMYERMGLISPQRTSNNIRLFSDYDVERVRRIQHLTQELGVNLAGVEVVFKLLTEMERMRAEVEARLAEVEQGLEIGENIKPRSGGNGHSPSPRSATGGTVSRGASAGGTRADRRHGAD
jgi:MerR family transcriptional regulator, heat shock protein HspR